MLEILDDHDQRALGRQQLEHPAQRPVQVLLLAAGLAEAEQLGHLPDDTVIVDQRGQPALGLGERAAFLDPRRTLDDLRDRFEGDALAVWTAPSMPHRRELFDLPLQLVHKAGLPDTSLPEHRQQVAAALGGGSLVESADNVEVVIAADHRCGEAKAAIPGRPERAQSPHRYRLSFAPQWS